MFFLITIFVVTYVLIASEKIDKAVAAFVGAALVIAFHYISYEEAVHHIDLNVIFLILGMMIMVNVLSRMGLFEWLAMTIAKRSKGNALLIIIQLLLITAVFSAFLDNVTTVILIAPITILITQILEVSTMPVLVMEAVFSNIGGTATLVGDPPNIIIGSSANLSFNEFIINLTPVVLIVLFFSLLFVYFPLRKRSFVAESSKMRIMKSHPHLAITDQKKLNICLVVFSFVLLGFFLGRVLNIEPGIVALSGGLVMSILSDVKLHDLLGKVEWATIIFFIGLFMLIGALQVNGVFTYLGKEMIELTEGDLVLTVIIVLWFSAIVSAVVDNIPLVVAMIPLINSIIPAFAAQMGIEHDPAMIDAMIKAPLFWSLALGACLGGNGSLIGASANVVISQIAKKNNYPLTFGYFTRLSLPLMLLSLIICTIYIYLRYFL